MCCFFYSFFFFSSRRRHTRCGRDWSSDVCSSDLLANSDRWADDGVFSRDLIDLAMMDLPLKILRSAVFKAEQAYGDAVIRDLGKAIDHMRERDGWLDRCIQAMAMTAPRAAVWSKVRRLKRLCNA